MSQSSETFSPPHHGLKKVPTIFLTVSTREQAKNHVSYSLKKNAVMQQVLVEIFGFSVFVHDLIRYLMHLRLPSIFCELK